MTHEKRIKQIKQMIKQIKYIPKTKGEESLIKIVKELIKYYEDERDKNNGKK